MLQGYNRVEILLRDALKFQSVVLPNGLIANMYGPVGKLCMLYKIKNLSF